MQNPINMIDPDGRALEDWYRNRKTGKIKRIEGSKTARGYQHLGYNYNNQSAGPNGTDNLIMDGNTKIISMSGVIIADFNNKGSVTTDGIKVYGYGGDPVAGSGDIAGDRGSGSTTSDSPAGKVAMLWDFGQLIGSAINWIKGNSKPVSKEGQGESHNYLENKETVRYRETTGKGTRIGNMILPDYQIKDTVVPESKASKIYEKLNKKFQDDWKKQIKKDN